MALRARYLIVSGAKAIDSPGMIPELESAAGAVDAEIGQALALPTVKRVLAMQAKTVAANARRRAAGSMTFAMDTPLRAPLIPMLVERASGCRVVDLDGNEFIDLHLGFWTGLLGHAPKVVVDAIQREAERGTTVGLGHTVEIELGEFLIEHIACAEMCCLAVSGTSAVMHALKLARFFRGRRLVAKFGNQYHGHDGDMLVDLPEFARGITRSEHTLVLPRTAEAFDIIRAHADALAGVILEPAPPVREPDVAFYTLDFYRELRRLTQELGIVLIFDEVLRGFRSRFGGTLDDKGVIPDLACFGKIIGGGMPVAAVVGRRTIMECGRATGNSVRDQHERIPLMATYSGNRLACVAGLAQLKHIAAHQAEIYPYIAEKAQWLASQIGTHAGEHQMSIEAFVLDGGLVMLRPVRSRPSPMHPLVLLQTYLRAQGIYFNGGPFQLSPAHTPGDIEAVSSGIRAALAALRDDRAIG